MPDILTYKINGDTYDVPEDKATAFLEKYPDAVQLKSFVVGKDTFDIPEEKMQAFQERYPDAEPTFGDTPPTTYPNQGIITDKNDNPVVESDAEGFLSDAFKKGAEWVGRSGLMNSAMWKGFMAQGMIQSKLESGGTAQEGMDLYREESQKQREKLAEHDPTGFENTAAFVLSMSLDATAFAGYGTMGKGAAMGTLRGISAAKNFMISQGLKPGTVSKVLPKATKIAGEVLKGSATSSAALGGHTFSSGLLTALEEHDIDDILYSEELRSSVVGPAGQSAKIGGVLGPLSVGTGVVAQAAHRSIGNNIGRFLATKGIQTAGFGGEVTTFAGLGALLNDEKLTWEDLKHTAIELGALKLSHGGTAAGKKILGKGFRKSEGFTEKDRGKGIYELYLTESETDRLGVKDKSPQKYIERIDREGNLEKIMDDPNVSMTTKAKLLWSARGVAIEKVPDVAVATVKDKDGRHEVELRDDTGELIDSQIYADKGEAMSEALSWQKRIEHEDAMSMAGTFDAKQTSNLERQVRENDIDLSSSGKHWDDLTPKERDARDKVHDIIAEIGEPKEVIKPEELSPEKKVEVDRQKEILKELKREDLPQEEREALSEEMDKLLYTEPDRGQTDMVSEERRIESEKRVEEGKLYLDVGEGEAFETLQEKLDWTKDNKAQLETDISVLEEMRDRSNDAEKTLIDSSVDAKKEELGKINEGIKSIEEVVAREKSEPTTEEKPVVKEEQDQEEVAHEKRRDDLHEGVFRIDENASVAENTKAIEANLEVEYNKIRDIIGDNDLAQKYINRIRKGRDTESITDQLTKEQREKLFERIDESDFQDDASLKELREADNIIDIADSELIKTLSSILTQPSEAGRSHRKVIAKEILVELQERGISNKEAIRLAGGKKIAEGIEESDVASLIDSSIKEAEAPPKVEEKPVVKEEEAPPKEEVIEATVEDVKKEGSESLLASFRGFTGYWDLPKDKSGKLEEERDSILEMLEKDRETKLAETADVKERKRLEAYYDKQKRNVGKLFTRDKAKAQKFGDAVLRDTFHDFIQENRSELQKVHGNVVPSMLNALTRAKTPAQIRNAFDYIQKVLDKKAERDLALEESKNINYLDEMTDPAHKKFLKRKDQITRLKNNQEATKETIGRLDRIREFQQGEPDPGSKTKVPKTRSEAFEEISTMVEKSLEANEPLTPEQYDRISDLFFSNRREMTRDDIALAAERVEDIVKEGKTKAEQQRQANLGDRKMGVKELVEDLTGETQEISSYKKGGMEPPNESTMVKDIIIGNRNWQSWLDAMSVHEFRKAKGKIGVYEGKLNQVWDRELTQPAELKNNTLKREDAELIAKTFTDTFTPTLDPKYKSKFAKKAELKAKAIAHEVEPVEIPYEGITKKKHVLETNRDKLIEMYQYMQNPELHRDLAKQGVEVNGDVLFLKRPVTERGEDGKLRETGEYENTNLGDQLESFMDPASELGKKYKTEGLKKWAEKGFELYEGWWERDNPVYEERFGVPMPKNSRYTPLSRSGKGNEGMTPEEMLASQSAFSMGHNRHLYTRTGSNKPLMVRGASKVMNAYVNRMTTFNAKSGAIEKLNAYWKDPAVQRAIRDEHGIQNVIWLNNFLDHFSGKNTPNNIKWVDMLRRNIMVASLGVKPMIFMKQLTSFPAYSLFLPKGQLTRGIAEAIFNPNREIIEAMKKDEYILNRYKGVSGNIDRDLADIQARANRMKKNQGWDFDNFRDQMMALVKYGDKGPIITGGYAAYSYAYNKVLKARGSKAKAHEAGAKKMRASTKYAQQASDITDLSPYQRGGSWMKMFTMYQTAPMSYHRIASGGLRRLGAGMKSGNKAMMYEGARQFFIAHVVLPVIFQAAGNFFQMDTKEKKWDLARAAVLGNANSLFAIGDFIEHLSNTAFGKPFEYSALPATSIVTGAADALIDLKDIIEKSLDGEKITWEDIQEVMDELEYPISQSLGLPGPGIINLAQGIQDVATGETEGVWDSAARVAGLSMNAIEAGRDEKKKEQDNVRKPRTRKPRTRKRR